VNLPRYFIARYPVTVAQFRAFAQASGYEPRDKRSLVGQANHPVTQVTLHDAVKYCEWLTETLKSWEGAPEAIARLVRGLGWQATLPSEAEWEKAARGDRGQIFPWGDTPNPNAANYAEAGVGQTTAVGCFPAGASPYGGLDMAGNVWEWTHSAHKLYPYDPRDGREDLRGISFLVMRGGGFDDHHASLRCACRSWFYLAGHFKDGGFRVALSSAKM
jgi:formylglycine-generating enzyme required for sulfatase activity